MNFKDKESENNGYDEDKNRMVVKALLFIEKKLEHVFRDSSEKIDLKQKMEQVRANGSMSKHMIRNYGDMVYHQR